tara:strand:+ start:2897 stop:4741 length:1845 start_codon:yes stop_codon:yes gene_type:complete
MAIEKTININVEDKDALKSINNIEAASKGAEKGVGGISKGFKGLGVAIKAAGIGIVIAALAKLGQVFSQNQKVADLFNTAFEAVSIAFNDFVNFAVKNTSGIIKFFDAIFKNPLESLKGFAKAFKENIQERFDSYLDTLGYLASAVKKVFSGDFAGALDDVKNAGKESLDVLTGVNDSFDKGKEFIEKTTESIKDYATETLNAAKENVNLANTAQLAAAQQTLLVEKYDRQAEQLRQIRDEERNSITERKKANDDLLEVLESQEKAMLATANAQLASAQAEAAKNNSIENQVAVTDALANRLGVLAQIEGFRSEQKANDLALDREQIELTNSKGESESRLSIERKRFNAEQIEDELARLEALKEIDLLEAEQETIRLEAIVENANAETQAKVDAQIALDEFTEQSRQTNLTRNTEIAEAEAALEEKKTASRQKSLDDLITIGGAESKFGKAMLIAKQLILARELIMDIQGTISAATAAQNKSAVKASEAGVDVATGAAKAVSAFAPPFNIPIILGYAAQAVGIVSAIKGAMSKSKAATSKFGAAGGGGSVSAPSVPSAPSLPPSFNIVGASDTNQLADAVAGQSQAPIQTYVVANDVTTAQSLQNNIVEGATIG